MTRIIQAEQEAGRLARQDSGNRNLSINTDTLNHYGDAVSQCDNSLSEFPPRARGSGFAVGKYLPRAFPPRARGRVCGLHETSVRNFRTELESGGIISQAKTRLGKNGVEQSAEKQVVNITTETEPEPPPPPREGKVIIDNAPHEFPPRARGSDGHPVQKSDKGVKRSIHNNNLTPVVAKS